ncbi:putative g1 s regulator [Phaeomoniella chlamydospora]|uniref:Putative g1 s regulator n=1 Tax=Phaeomoniella chlamydospora TaxID=158046 RepID=A0A0G2DV39_PHACM|nr:putative g1 s regulator [Phaeomoniella chlamydospora]
MAAAVSIPPSPHAQFTMSTSRRAPLASIPHVTNSPHRSLAQNGMKRPRQILQQENEPPLKKQLVDRQSADTTASPRKRIPPPTSAEGRVFESGTSGNPPNAFARRLVAAKSTLRAGKPDKSGLDGQDATKSAGSVRVTRAEKASLDNAENIRQWQKHYRRVFPTFVFYFESVPEDLRNKCSRQVASLGAQEEKFFSRYVTHVVTTRPVPSEGEETSPTEPQTNEPQIRTINPSLLDRSGAVGIRRDQSGNADILTRARQMGMKIWALEKLQRIIATVTSGTDAQFSHTTRGNAATMPSRTKEDDLSQLLRKERMNGPAERDPLVATKDIVHFKGPFILIRDMDEKNKPVMVREYPKAAKRQDGTWPQFRSAPIGKCPFLDDHTTQKEWEREAEREERERRKGAMQKERLQNQAPVTRSQTADAKPDRSVWQDEQHVQVEDDGSNAPSKSLARATEPLNSGAGESNIMVNESERILPRQESQSSTFAAPMSHVRPNQMYFAREPAASGMNQSMITSAIRSQMISSTAAAPGAKTGLSKEVHELKRKVLEKNNGSLSAGSMPSSYRMNDLAAQMKNARAPAPQRVAKSKAQEKLGGIKEEETYSEDELAIAQAAAKPKKKVSKRDPKPGYCENCRDKFDDFEEHTFSRKHRKFAATHTNWTELDALLRILQSY